MGVMKSDGAKSLELPLTSRYILLAVLVAVSMAVLTRSLSVETCRGLGRQLITCFITSKT